MVTISRDQNCQLGWLTSLKIEHCWGKKNNGNKPAVPAKCAAQALVVQQNRWTATNGQRGPSWRHAFQNDYCTKPNFKRPKGNFKQTMQEPELLYCMFQGIAPRYSFVYTVYIGPLFPHDPNNRVLWSQIRSSAAMPDLPDQDLPQSKRSSAAMPGQQGWQPSFRLF